MQQQVKCHFPFLHKQRMAALYVYIEREKYIWDKNFVNFKDMLHFVHTILP